MSKEPFRSAWLPDDAELRSRATSKMFAWGLAGSLLLLGGFVHFVREGTMLSASFGALIAAVNVYFAWQERRKFKS